MAALGGAITQNFSIGTAELRIGDLSQAGNLTQLNSVGLLQSANINIARQFAELRGGFANKRIHQHLTGYDVEVNANLYEFSTRNLNLLLNNSQYSQEAAERILTQQNITLTTMSGTAFSGYSIPGFTGSYSGKSYTIAKDTVINVTVDAALAAIVSDDFSPIEIVYWTPGTTSKTCISKSDKSSVLAKRISATTIALKFTSASILLSFNTDPVKVTLRESPSFIYPTFSTASGYSAQVAGKTTITLDKAIATGIAGRKLVIGVYAQTNPEQLTMVEATFATSGDVAMNTLTFDTPGSFDTTGAQTPLVVYLANMLSLAPQEQQQYFTCDLVSQNKKTKKVQGFRLWKVAFQGEIPFNFSGTDYNTLPLKLVAFEPDEEDLAGDLAGVADLVRTHTFGMHWGG